MRAIDKIKIITVGSAMLITSAAALGAGEPIAYDGFLSSGGTITATGEGNTGICDPTTGTFTCGTPLKGNGFYQRSITEKSSGTTYFQTIILPNDTDVTAGTDITKLPFADENFVLQGGGTGIADKQSNYALHTTSNPGDFTSTTNIDAGWATPASGDVVTLSQNIKDLYDASSNPNGSDFELTFGLTGDGTQATSLHIDQSVSLCADVTSSCTDKQKLDVRRLIAASAGDTAALPTGDQLQGLAQVHYSADDVIQAVWLGQAVTTSGTAQDLSGFQGYTNITTDVFNGYSDQTVTGPWNYDTVFNVDYGSGTLGTPSF